MAGMRLLAVTLFGWKATHVMYVYWRIKTQKYGRKYYIIIMLHKDYIIENPRRRVSWNGTMGINNR